jgi:hyperosmotically inducible periplasmic protein
MQKILVLLTLVLFTLGGPVSLVQAASDDAPPPAAQSAPDNTGRNIRDRSGAALTPGDQSETKADRTLTQRIRRALVKDKSLSTNAHNIKIITTHDAVTLRGPVKSAHERDTIVAKAQQLAGSKQIDNQLEIAHD